MTPLAKHFRRGMGRPAPATENAIHFEVPGARLFWEMVSPDLGAGWYLDRFVYLFGPGLERLHRCLKAWSFLVPPDHPDRLVLGYNIHGAILVLEDAKTSLPKVLVLEPYRIAWWTHEHLGFENLLARWLPDRELPEFLDTEVYTQWRKSTGEYLAEDMILAPKLPKEAGGSRDLENFQVENLFDFYERTGREYAKLAKGGKPPGPKGRKR
ncbi:hypothetical protein [Pyxidicoccus xibeiensis]|uniref:hypothetical protein n=1 Tax=Pyxidicoccus xibeiensis TaxID=2906759 RepID=UPI0020A6F040|nr:hypothetical protein [Pyxidicoccus xibeiensis]MCP3143947.1 hypothetical protein [Pyxidicoccus xibeiensis]